jgi:hypothetical protein
VTAVWSGGLGSGRPAWAGFGYAAEGHFEAESAELAGVVGDLAAGVALAFVVVGAEAADGGQHRGAFTQASGGAGAAVGINALGGGDRGGQLLDPGGEPAGLGGQGARRVTRAA